MKHKLIIIGIAVVIAACSQNGKPIMIPENDGSKAISTRLSNQKVNSFAQDKDGHIWIATFRGLNKYTSKEFYQYFCTDDESGIPDNQINSILATSDGKLWLGTINGVAYRTPDGLFKRVPIPTKYPNISQVLETRKGTVLFSSSSTLYRYVPEQEKILPAIRDFNAFGIPSTIIGDDGNLWVITDNGFKLNCYSDLDFSIIASYNLPHQVYHICNGQDGELWLAGMGHMSIMDSRNGSFKELPASIQSCIPVMHGDIDHLFRLNDNSMLLNVIGKGFFIYDRAHDIILSESDKDFPLDIPDTEVRTIFKDRQDNIWFGTTDHGFHVSYKEHSQFGCNKFLTKSFKGKNVTALCADKQGGLWINTLRDGLFRYDISQKTIQEVNTDHLISDGDVGYIRAATMYCDRDGDLWVVFTEKMRVIRCRWDGKKLISKDIVYASSPLCVQEDDNGAIWIGGFSGDLIRFDKKDKSLKIVPAVPKGEWTFITDMIMDEPGKMLLACFNQPPTILNTYSFECTRRKITPEENAECIRRSVMIPNCLFKDSNENNWAGTIANGLLIHRNGSNRIESMEGIPCMDITAIEEDRQGNIWISTMNGLAKWDHTSGHFVHYFEADGIGGDQFNDRASCILPDGTLAFGGTHGITIFNPLDAPAKRTVPLVFESLTIHNNPTYTDLSSKPEVVIRHQDNAFRISFAALDYSEIEQIRYAYKLEGFDKDWVKINTGHDAYFANLPPRQYKLLVTIANGSHSITEVVESINVRVLPPWNKTWWAHLLFAILCLLIAYTCYAIFRHISRMRKDAELRIKEVRDKQEKAEEAQKAEKALNKIQMNYFANVAHEFRTPLTMISGPAQQLSASESIKGTDRQLVDIIRRNTSWMLSLVNQLLDFNRIGNSKLQMKVAKIDILEPLRDTASLFRFNAQSKGIELTTHGLEDSFTMWVDADKIQKIVMNLLSNALKFTPAGGKVTMSFDVITRAEAASFFPLTDKDTDGQWACICVSDTGCGIPEDQLEAIFERFYQLDQGKNLSGSGIGLYYARALCTLHHGYIKASNREEGGAQFRIVIPVSANSYSEDERTSIEPELPTHALAESIMEEQPEDESKKRHIVVVDDDIDIANYLKILLKPQYKVTLYFDGSSALRGLEEDAPDLIISDVVMPLMDGYQFCSHIKGDLQLSHIPVVLVTAKVAVENQIQGLDKGADAYVTKPFQPAYLLALVKSLLENREKLHRQLGSVTTTEDIAPEALSPRDAAFMKELYELMEKELANADLDIIKMTEMMKISRTKFYYKVKGLTGENPSIFFKRYKLNRAADLLKEGKYNMSEIAWMTGFNTLSHFSTSFKKQFGVPPSEYLG